MAESDVATQESKALSCPAALDLHGACLWVQGENGDCVAADACSRKRVDGGLAKTGGAIHRGQQS